MSHASQKVSFNYKHVKSIEKLSFMSSDYSFISSTSQGNGGVKA